MQNIEFKAELRDLDAARRQCATLGAAQIGTFDQVDTYYRLPDGRLKRRVSPGEPTMWIFYHRPDRIRPRMSNYTVLNDQQACRRWGTHSLREWLVVRKTREMWLMENVRIHLDRVEKLGRFIEFEAIVTRQCDVRRCHQHINRLRAEFRPVLGEPVAVSYSDLLHQEQPIES